METPHLNGKKNNETDRILPIITHMKNNTQLIEEYKTHINALSNAQDKLFSDLENLLDSDDEKFNEYVFDYIYNGDESSFAEYLSRYGPKN